MRTESHIRHLTAAINVVTPYMHKDSMACKEVPMHSLQQIWSLFQFTLPKEDSGASQEQSQQS